MQADYRERAPRIRLGALVQVYDGTVTRPGVVTNLSDGGLFLAIQPPIPIDRGISFWLDLGGERLEIRAHVRWTRSLPAGVADPVGSGLQFYDPDGALAPRIRRAIDRLREGI